MYNMLVDMSDAYPSVVGYEKEVDERSFPRDLLSLGSVGGVQTRENETELYDDDNNMSE